MFIPTTEYGELETGNKEYIIPKTDEVLLNTGEYQWVERLKPGDILNTNETVDHLVDIGKSIKLYVM